MFAKTVSINCNRRRLAVMKIYESFRSLKIETVTLLRSLAVKEKGG